MILLHLDPCKRGHTPQKYTHINHIKLYHLALLWLNFGLTEGVHQPVMLKEPQIFSILEDDSTGSVQRLCFEHARGSPYGIMGCMEAEATNDQFNPVAGELVIPVYLDTNVLLDLLATVEDGFSLVERVSSGKSTGRSSELSSEAEFGTPSLFHFFKLGLSGKLGRSTTEGSSERAEAERTHTYGSLLHRLRRYLVEQGLVTSSFEGGTHDVGSFVEFSGVIRPNPFTDSFLRLQRILGFVDVVMGLENISTPAAAMAGGKGNRGQGQQQRKQPQNPQTAQLKAMAEFIHRLTEDVEREGTSTVMVEGQSSDYRAVVTLFDDYLRDRSMAEILNREFRVLGKIARHLPPGSSESVDLLASSGVAGLPPELLSELTSSIDKMVNTGGMQITRPAITVDAPVMEIVPIAIYL